MLREPRDPAQEQESESDVSGSDSEDVEEQEHGQQEAEEEERNENGNEGGKEGGNEEGDEDGNEECDEEGDEEGNGLVVERRKLANANQGEKEISRSNETQNGDTSCTFHRYRGNSNDSPNGSGSAMWYLCLYTHSPHATLVP